MCDTNKKDNYMSWFWWAFPPACSYYDAKHLCLTVKCNADNIIDVLLYALHTYKYGCVRVCFFSSFIDNTQALEGVYAPLHCYSMMLCTGHVSLSQSGSHLPSHNSQTIELLWRLILERKKEFSIKWLSAKLI